GRNVPMSHCPGSNLKAGKGTCPVLDLMDRGVVVSLGTDGASSGNTLDHFTQLKLAAIAQKTMHHDRALMTARECAPLGNRNAGFALRAPIGMLKAGYQADIAVLSLQSPRMHPLYDPYSALCYSATGGDVQDVWVAGVRKVADGELVGIDLPALYAEFDDAAKAFKAEAP
ncbi:MAG TPA: amidohydrolase, partial [Sphaerochaeta sp.]|nr:amidohydrolase [Sphaerochaeta sp.]